MLFLYFLFFYRDISLTIVAFFLIWFLTGEESAGWKDNNWSKSYVCPYNTRGLHKQSDRASIGNEMQVSAVRGRKEKQNVNKGNHNYR